MSEVTLLLNDSFDMHAIDRGQISLKLKTPDLDLEDLLCQLDDDDLGVVVRWICNNNPDALNKNIF